MKNIFVYGTLQCREITENLTGKIFFTMPAVLHGYRLFMVKDRDYPAIVRKEHSEVSGLVIKDVDDNSFEIISFFEGEEYECRNIQVIADGKQENVLAFVWAKEIEMLEDVEWDLHRFEQESSEHYITIVIPEMLEEFKDK